MLRLELSDEAQEALASALESYLSDLRLEITDTENLDYRERLKREEAILNGVLGALGHASPGAR